MSRPYVPGEPLGPSMGLPPNDGTGIPLPVDANGWPVVPGGAPAGPPPTVTNVQPNSFSGSQSSLTVNGTNFTWDLDYKFVGPTTVSTNIMDVAANGSYVILNPAGAWAVGSYSLVITDNGTPYTFPNVVTVTGAALAADEQVAQPADAGYDPGQHTVAEVQQYLGEHPDQSQYVLDRERAGKSRSTLIGA